MEKRWIVGALSLAAVSAMLAGCAGNAAPHLVVMTVATPEPTPVTVHLTVTAEANEALAPLPTLPPTPTPSPTPTATPTATPTVTPEPTATPTTKPKKTPTPTPKRTPTPKPAETCAPDPTDPPESVETPAPTHPNETVIQPVITAPPTPEPTKAPVLNAAPDNGGYAEDYSVPASVTVSGKYSAADISLAARVAAMEAGKTEDGYRAVLCVILNRVESSRWPDSVSGVCFQESQFTVVNKKERFWGYSVPTKVYEYANDVLNNGNRLLPKEIMSFRASKDDKKWGDRAYFKTYGGNDFYY